MAKIEQYSLLNASGSYFDSDHFSRVRDAKKWAAGRSSVKPYTLVRHGDGANGAQKIMGKHSHGCPRIIDNKQRPHHAGTN